MSGIKVRSDSGGDKNLPVTKRASKRIIKKTKKKTCHSCCCPIGEKVV